MRAFTLIELLVVIAIIAVLAALLMPALERARNSAREVVCVSQVHQFSTAFFAYGQDWEEFIPNGGHTSGYIHLMAMFDWTYEVMPYLGYVGSLQEARAEYIYPSVGIYQCPTNDCRCNPSWWDGPTASYGFNYQGGSLGYYTPPGTGPVYIKFSKLSHPYGYVIMGDNNHSSRQDYYAWLRPGMVWGGGTVYPLDAHQDGGNILWGDLGVQWVSEERLLNNRKCWMWHSWTGCNYPSYCDGNPPRP